MKKAKKFWNTYKHGAWITVYLIFYMLGFFILENAGHRHYHIIHSVFDDMIPFCEYFIIPYYLWFAYVAAGILWFVFRCKNHTEYYKMCSALAIGMTVFLVVSCVFPNAQDLRPSEFLHHNVCTQLVRRLYQTDTPTNVLPSIHVFNSLIIFFALNNSRQLQRYRAVRFAAGTLTVLIILSTMFLKQHSIVDVSMGTLMAIAVQMLCDRVFAEKNVAVRETSAFRSYNSREF